ncbi:hypothetical protein ACH436_06460 [Isoptericola sp. NPDC019693]|uniref:hypothetical protein n=1 Tax=Isoptericola sp. NPDC019693 TaxID=3364009 RepID=UPI003789AA3E
MSNDRQGEGEIQQVFYWVLALVSLVAIRQLWTAKLRPWFEQVWGEIQSGEVADLPVVGRLDQADVVGVGVLVVLLLAIFVVVASAFRKRRRMAHSSATKRRSAARSGTHWR